MFRPPGTGKTFIGVKIVKLLLHNSNLWCNQSFSRKRPILMLCYTNHALDQFLEYCVTECSLTTGVVRVGGRCKNRNLEGFLLKNIKNLARQERSIDKSIFYQTKTEFANMYEIQNLINTHFNMIEMANTGILKLNILQDIMEPYYYDQFRGSSVDLLDWLGFKIIENNDDDELASNFQIDLNNNQAKIDVDEEINEVSDDEYDDDDDERMLDEDFVFNQGTKNPKNLSGKVITDYIDDKSTYCFTESDLQTSFNKKITDGWIEVGKKGKPNNSIKMLLKKITENTVEKEILTNNLWSLNSDDRICMYTRWVNLFKRRKTMEIQALKQQYNESFKILQELRLQEDRYIMQNAYIIAMTTTGSARYHTILKDIGPRIVIIEEAAEVFESHIVSSLSRHCEHLILIGDHVQLKPKPNVFELAKNYNMDMSLFERLIKNKLEYVTLTCQHRMRPEISILMKHFYDIEIKDHDTVKNRDNIIGVNKNIFFICHTNAEDNYDEGKSKINKFEARYLVKFAKYLIRQHYSPTQITILTTYLGQMFYIREELRREKVSKDVRIITVDNYQGEENDIILLSLVRSNKEEKIGFLSIENRICVALSRARNGLFCIGNFNLLNKTSLIKKTKWSAILDSLKKTDSIGDGLHLSCGKHLKNDILALNPSDFDKRPEGGCSSLCDYRLDCGHTCSYFCHLYDPNHETIKCTKECGKPLKCGHSCKKQCNHKSDCAAYDCNVSVQKLLNCGHNQKASCFKKVETIICTDNCKRVLNCKHMCSNKCSVQPCGPCKQLIEKCSICKHPGNTKVPCGTEVWKFQEFCCKKCSIELNCGHLCKSNCGDCYGGRIHASCQEKCDRILVCGHKCKTPCAKQCPPCASKCENRCFHSKCPGKCSLPCIPCKEQCIWSCEHKKCTKLCYQKCDRDPCNFPCSKKLKCEHPCIGFCGEVCPKLCKICDKEKVTEIFFGTEDENNARFVLLEDCGHIVEAEGMKNWMETQYGTNSSNNDQNANVIKLPECPKCKTPIRLNLRFSSYVKQQLFAIEQVKIKSTGTKAEILNEKNEFIKYLIQNENKIENEFFDTFSTIMKKVEQEKNFSKADIIELKNRFLFYFKLFEIENNNKMLISNAGNKACLDYEMKKIKKILFPKNINNMQPFSIQSQTEISNEIMRIDRLYQYFKCKEHLEQKSSTFNSKPYLEDLIKLEYLLVNKVSIYQNIEKEVNELLKKLKPYLSGLQISEEERVMILKAMKLSQGHWYKCKNGHVYCITECGGAMQESQCPECGDKIGGTQHRLVENNAVATEMDGARVAAWSEQANMANFDLNDII